MRFIQSCTSRISGPPGPRSHPTVNQSNRFTRLSLVVAGTVLLAGCSTFNISKNRTPVTTTPAMPSSQAAEVSPVDRTIALDVVRVARQIFTPLSTTLQFSKDNDDALLEYFIVEFANAGFGVQRVSADQGSNFFTYTRREDVDDSGKPLVSVNASIGAVEIGRDYTIPRNNTISPASPVQLSGTRMPVDVPDKQSGRFVVTTPEHSKAVYVASMNLDDQAPPVISLITDELVSAIASQSTQSNSLQALNSSRVEVSNLFYSDQSNFSSILDDYEQIERQIVVFGNDSMVLGNTNKLLIEQFVEQRIGRDDLVSLVGCSNGPTALDMGNEGLALGRAKRVTQELLSQGVARERILDEGCWAPVSAGKKYPGRGVVMELWREKS